MMKTTNFNGLFLSLRLILGLTLLTFGLNGFINFYPLPDTTTEAREFLGSLWKSGYLMHLEKLMEITVGVLLLVNRFVPLALITFLPVAINIALVDTLLQPQYWYYGCTILILNILLIIRYRNSYKSILVYREALVR